MPSIKFPVQQQSSSTSTGSKPFSLSINNRGPSGGGTSSRKRLHSSLDNESDSDDNNNKPQLLTGFDRTTGTPVTAETAAAHKEPLVIAKQKNRDWRAEAAKRQGKNLLPAEEQARRAGVHVEGQQQQQDGDAIEHQPTYGLLVAQQSSNGHSNGTRSETETTAPIPDNKPKTVDEEALDALLGKHERSSNLVIPNASMTNETLVARQSDTHSFRADVDARPDMPSLSDYAAVPIEEFGKALMRGMGWKEGQELGRAKGATGKQREVKRRPALLGIGAKEAPEGLEELGAWGKGTKTRRIDTSYMPLVMQNSKTGEKLTEEELEKRKQQEKLVLSERNGRSEREGRNEREDRDERRGRHKDSDSRAEHRRHRDTDGRDRYEDSSSRRRHRSSERKDSDHDRDRKSYRKDEREYGHRRERSHRYDDDDDRNNDDNERRHRRKDRNRDRDRDRRH